MRPLAPVLIAGIISTIGFAAADQDSAPRQTPTFRAAVDLVQVDVSVLDRSGRPVRGLQAEDFRLLENGRPQAIVAFVPVDVPEPAPGGAPWLREIAPDVRTNALGDGRLFAIVIDDATMPFEVRTLSNARQIARQIVNHLGPADLAAVIYTQDTRRSIDFTNDHARLLANIESFSPGFAYTDPQTDNVHFFNSVRTLGQVSAYLSTVPHRRKALIYVSSGVPVDPETVARVTLISARREEGTLEESTAEELVQSLSELLSERPQEAYGSAMQDALVRAQHGNVNIYSIDPAGLGGLQSFLQNRTTVQQMDRTTRAPAGAPVRADPLDAVIRARLSRDFLQTVAENTGGRAILNTNGVEAGVAQIFRENSAYYLIGYQSSREAQDRKVRRVEVRVNRPGVSAHTRNAYFDPRSRPRPLAAPAPVRLTEALSGILPKPDVSLQAAAAPFASPGRRGATLAIAVGVHHTAPGDVGARVQEMLSLLATAFTPRGELRGRSNQTARVVFRSGTGEEARYEILTRLDLEPGRYQVRLAAHSSALNRSGSVYIDVEVPEFGPDTLQLSGVVLSADPGWPAAPPDALADLLPVVPTSVREFPREATVTAFARVYGGARADSTPLAVNTSVTDDAGTVVFRGGEPLPAARFNADGAADHRFDLPFAKLTPGRYLLTVEVTGAGRRVARHVRFSIK